MSVHIWLRAESKPHEERSALTPATAAELLRAGFAVSVERSAQSAIPAEDFAAVGCRLVPAGSWPQAPDDAFILGLKELPDDGSELHHRHIHFAHAFKEQRGWQDVLRRFARGGGQLYDLEFLLDDNGRRVAAFGYWAGFTGAAVAVKTWCGQRLGRDPVVPPLHTYASRDALLAELREELVDATNAATSDAGRRPTAMVIGALGRVGSGACGLADALGLAVTRWDMAETAVGGPFAEILAHELFINCVMVNAPLPPFITDELLDGGGEPRRLSVISDVSCDPFGDYNPLPVYKACTTFPEPTLRLREASLAGPALDLIAIDHLPSMLPAESSEDFSTQLLPHLLQLGAPDNPVWRGALGVFHDKSRGL